MWVGMVDGRDEVVFIYKVLLYVVTDGLLFLSEETVV